MHRQELKPCLKPKFYSLICSLDPCTLCLAFLSSRQKSCSIKGEDLIEASFFLFLYSGSTGRKSIHEFLCHPASSFLSRETLWSLGRCCLKCTSSLFIFPAPHLHSHAAMQAGRGVEGNAIDSCCPGAPGSASSAKPLRRLENFLKLFPPACSSTSI